MAMRKVHDFHPSIYPCRLWVYIGSENMEDEFSKVEQLEDDSIAETQATRYLPNGKRGVLVRFRSRKAMTAEIITHESVHAAAEILRSVGGQIDVDNQEPLAYLAGWVADCIDQVKKNKFKE